jgi:hypothetical protein
MFDHTKIHRFGIPHGSVDNFRDTPIGDAKPAAPIVTVSGRVAGCA